VEGGGIRLAEEVRYIQHRAANHDGRIVTIGQLVLFSTETGDAWLLDRTDFLAARLARNGEAEPIQIVETAATFAIEWKGSYRINGPAFVYSDQDTGRAITILGYPNSSASNSAATLNTAQAGNFKYVWLALPGHTTRTHNRTCAVRYVSGPPEDIAKFGDLIQARRYRWTGIQASKCCSMDHRRSCACPARPAPRSPTRPGC
jgi:hypothetical protein